VFVLFPFSTLILLTTWNSRKQLDWERGKVRQCYALCLVILSYLVRVIILYLYSTSILYYRHLPLTGHLPEITKISILNSFTLTIPCAYLLTILGQTFSQLIAFVPVDSPWLPSILLYLHVAQLWSDLTHLFFSRCVTLLCTRRCILQIMTCLLSVVWLVLLYSYISPPVTATVSSDLVSFVKSRT